MATAAQPLPGLRALTRDNAVTGEAAYRAKHATLGAALAIGGRVWTAALMRRHPPLPLSVIKNAQRRLHDTMALDLENVRKGYYPASLIHDLPIGRFLSQVPIGMVEMIRILRRAQRNAFDDLPRHLDLERYPKYYRRTFHWQSDGWLSERSAELYDLSVEFLFAGTAAMMRRMSIPAIVDSVRDNRRPKILDVTSGTGSYIGQLHAALPRAELIGIDLSPFYVRHARKAVPNARFEVANGERIPYATGEFDVVTSVFLFHELPKDARRRVINEMKRVVRPGGRIVICDSAQANDGWSRDLAGA